VQGLWAKFILAKEDEIVQYIKCVQQDFTYLPHIVSTFIDDIRQTEAATAMRILP